MFTINCQKLTLGCDHPSCEDTKESLTVIFGLRTPDLDSILLIFDRGKDVSPFVWSSAKTMSQVLQVLHDFLRTHGRKQLDYTFRRVIPTEQKRLFIEVAYCNWGDPYDQGLQFSLGRALSGYPDVVDTDFSVQTNDIPGLEKLCSFSAQHALR